MVWEEDKPRPLREGGVLFFPLTSLTEDTAPGSPVAVEGDLPFDLSETFPPGALFSLTSRSARAPKLILRPNGVAGMLLVFIAASSSTATSSMELLFVLEMLSRRPKPKAGLIGEPDRPIVVSDMRRL